MYIRSVFNPELITRMRKTRRKLPKLVLFMQLIKNKAIIIIQEQDFHNKFMPHELSMYTQ
jgi:hypothetical protein